MKLTCKEICTLFYEKEHKIKFKKWKKIHYRIYMCEKYDTYSSKTEYTFSRITFDNNNIYLRNRYGRIKKILNRQNTCWIACIFLYDKNLEFKLCDYDYTEIKEVEV